MKEFVLYDAHSATNVDQSLDNLLRVFNDLEDVAETVDYQNGSDRETYKTYVKSLRRYFERCEMLLIEERGL